MFIVIADRKILKSILEDNAHQLGRPFTADWQIIHGRLWQITNTYVADWEIMKSRLADHKSRLAGYSWQIVNKQQIDCSNTNSRLSDFYQVLNKSK